MNTYKLTYLSDDGAVITSFKIAYTLVSAVRRLEPACNHAIDGQLKYFRLISVELERIK